MKKDLSFEYPDAVLAYNKEHKFFPKDLHFEPGIYCAFDELYFIHTTATLPLTDIDDGIGFGLWVAVTEEDFIRYLSAIDDDTLYKEFITEGQLANEWPGFRNIKGAQVTVKTVRSDEKVFITAINKENLQDKLFATALIMQNDDTKTQEQVEDRIKAYLAD